MGLLAILTRKARSKSKIATSGNPAKSCSFRGAQVIATKEGCCLAAQNLAHKRFLVDEIPRLPLSDCDAEQCCCTYERFDDRRSELRRASDVGFSIGSQLHGEDNRNNSVPGRREDDAD